MVMYNNQILFLRATAKTPIIKNLKLIEPIYLLVTKKKVF